MRVVDDHIDRLWKLREQATSFAGIAAIEAAIAALSHAAGQDGEQCRAASVAPGEAEELAQWLDAKFKRHGEIEDKRAAELLRALSGGVPEGKCQHAWQPDPDVMNARYCPKCDVTQTIAAQRKEG